MPMIEDLERLSDLHRRSELTAEEYTLGKSRLLEHAAATHGPDCVEIVRLVMESEMGRLDREFAALRQECLIVRDGIEVEPDELSGVAEGWEALMILVFGGLIFWFTSRYGPISWLVVPLAVAGAISSLWNVRSMHRKYDRLTAARASYEWSRAACAEAIRLASQRQEQTHAASFHSSPAGRAHPEYSMCRTRRCGAPAVERPEA